MGTGAVGALVSRFHFGEGSEAIKILTLLFFFLNLLFFVTICAATIARYYIFPGLWQAMLQHPTQSLFIGAFPMGAATLINLSLTMNQKYSFDGPGFLYTLWAFWWLDCAVSVHGCRDDLCNACTPEIKDCEGKSAAELTEAERRALGITKRMPLSIAEARQALEQDSALCDVLGAEFVEKYLSVNKTLEAALVQEGENEQQQLTHLVKFY